LPDVLEDDLTDADDDVPLDVSYADKEELLQICYKTAEQRDLYRKKCVQVNSLNF